MKDVSVLFPPGYEWKGECIRLAVLYGLAVFYSLFYFGALQDAYESLFYYNGRSLQKELRVGAKMVPYDQVLGNYLIGLVLLAVFVLTIVVVHYLYYYQGSKSILLVRRLPDRIFLWKTCWAGPAFAMGGLILTYGYLYLLYYGIYIWVTPAACLP